MGLVDELKEGMRDEKTSTEKMIEVMIDPEEHLDSKSEVSDPLPWAVMQTTETVLETSGLTKSAELLKKFKKYDLTLALSHKRKSRDELKEMVKAVNHTKETENPDLRLMK